MPILTEQTRLLPSSISSASLELEKSRSDGARKAENKSRYAVPALVLLALIVAAISFANTSVRKVFNIPSQDEKDWHAPLSTKDPVRDLGLYDFDRPESSKPPFEHDANQAFPTNAWYLNLMLGGDQPGSMQRAYTIPYVLDVVGPIPGVRVHPNHVDGSSTEVHVDMIDQNGLTLGAISPNSNKKTDLSYKILEMTPLGITLQWVRSLYRFLFSKLSYRQSFSHIFVTLIAPI
jgi:hypothetical protein